MSDTPKNQEILGVILVLLLLGGQSVGKSSGNQGILGGLGGLGSLGSLGGPGVLSSLGKTLQLENFARDMHRIVAMMDQVEGLGKMAFLTPQAQERTQPKGLPEPAHAPSSQAHISGAAGSVADMFSNLSALDMGQLMEMAGPFLAMMGKQNK